MNLYVFFTFGVSLKTWSDTGMLSREMELYDQLQKRGVNVTLVTYGDESDKSYLNQYPGIKVLPIYSIIKKSNIPLFRLLNSLFILPFRLLPHVKNADVFKTKQMYGSWIPWINSIFSKKPYVFRTGFDYLYFHLQKGGSKLTYQVLKNIIKYVIRRAEIVLVSSIQDKDRMQEYCKNCKTDIIVTPNWVDMNKFRNFNKLKAKNKILFVGRLSEQKNLHLLIDSISDLDIELDIVGDGELRDSLKKYAEKTSVKVNFLGRFSNDELANLYNSYSIYILVSKYEGNPKTLLEAMSCELAVIGTNVIGIKEIIDDGVNGLIVEEDTKSVRNAIKTLIGDEDLRNRIGKNAREYILLNNSLSSYVDFEQNLFKRICMEK